MDKKKFDAILTLLVPQIIEMIVDRYQCDEITAAKEFYNSKVYEILEEEDTKLWHLSPLMLFHMYDEEKTTGTISFPEEA